MPIRDPEARRRYNREWMARRRAEWFAGRSCARCGSTDRLELDHVDPGTKIHHAIWSWSTARREVELAKCQALCHDCHQEKSRAEATLAPEHGTRNRYKQRCRCAECRAANAAYEAARRATTTRSNHPSSTPER